MGKGERYLKKDIFTHTKHRQKKRRGRGDNGTKSSDGGSVNPYGL